jgi:phospholipase/carboxylesterase
MRRMRPPSDPCSRREFLTRSAAACGIAAPGVVTHGGLVPGAAGKKPEPGRIIARPTAAAARKPLAPGVAPLFGTESPETLLCVPAGYTPDRPAPLAVALHGAGQTPRIGIAPLRASADALGLLILAPKSVDLTWDFMNGRYGPDVAAIDRALAKVFHDCNVDPARVALTGFSDGASYALSLGLTNGDLFTRLVAFSPGILAPAAFRGKPSIFVSHGTRDQILDIDHCSRRFVPTLRGDGYAVTYREFDGPHTVPPNIAEEAARFVART